MLFCCLGIDQYKTNNIGVNPPCNHDIILNKSDGIVKLKQLNIHYSTHSDGSAKC